MRYCFSRSLAARQSIRRRLVLALLVVLFVFGLSWASESWAAGYPPKAFQTTSPANNQTYTASTADAVCSAAVAPGGGTASRSNNDCLRNGAHWSWIIAQCDGSPGNVVNWTDATVNTLCSTPPPVNCSDPALVSKYVGAAVQGTATSLPSTVCIQGCAYSTGTVGVQVGTSYATDLGKGTGATCSGANYDTIDTTTKATDPPSLVSCAKQGKVYGTVNGVGICAAAGTIPNSTVTQNGSTTTQNTSASGVQGTPTTSTTTTTVSNVNNVSTVTTTTTNPDGSKSSTTQDQATYCQQNPSAQVCKGSQSSASGGTDCTAAPSCSGDAIQCMMVNQQWRTRCDSNQPSSLSDLGSKLVSGQDPVANPASSGNRTVNPIASSIDQSSFLNGAGLSDKVVSVSGQSITLPFSRLNQYLVWLGHLFVVISLIGAIRIVLGGFK